MDCTLDADSMATSLPPSSHPRPARAKRPITTYGRKTCIESLAAPAKTGSTLATEVNANGGGASSLRRAYHRDKKEDDVKFAASLLYFTYMKNIYILSFYFLRVQFVSSPTNSEIAGNETASPDKARRKTAIAKHTSSSRAGLAL